MIREDLSYIFNIIKNINPDALEENFNNLEELEQTIKETMPDVNFEEDLNNEDLKVDKEEFLKSFNELKETEKNPEINNLDNYKEQFKQIIQKSEELLNNPDIAEEQIKECKDRISSLNYTLESLDKVLSLDYLLECSCYGKFRKEKYIKYKQLAFQKLDRDTRQFLNPSIYEEEIKKFFNNDDKKTKKAMMKIYMYINLCKQSNMFYLYCVTLGFISLNNPFMKNRETMITALEKLADY